MLLAAGSATSRDGEVVRMNLKAESGLGALGQPREDFAWSFDDGPAVLADQMAVGAGRQVVGGGAVGQMSVHNNA